MKLHTAIVATSLALASGAAFAFHCPADMKKIDEALAKSPKLAAERLAEVCGEHGAWRCHSQFNCTEACPKGISPSDAIQALKRRALAEGARALAASVLRGIAQGSGRPAA